MDEWMRGLEWGRREGTEEGKGWEGKEVGREKGKGRGGKGKGWEGKGVGSYAR